MRETLEEIVEQTKSFFVGLADEAFGTFGVNIKSIGPMVRADYVYHLQARAYWRGLMMGATVARCLVGMLFLKRDVNEAIVKNRQLIEQRRTEQRQQQTTERAPNMLVSQDK
jgi:hypothetical protein